MAEPYAYTDVVPRVVNVADSRAERFNSDDGLCAAFTKACQRVYDIGALTRSGEPDLSPVRKIFNQVGGDYAASLKKAYDAIKNPDLFRIPGFNVGADGKQQVTDEQIEYQAVLRDVLRWELEQVQNYPAFSIDAAKETVEEFYEAEKADPSPNFDD